MDPDPWDQLDAAWTERFEGLAEVLDKVVALQQEMELAIDAPGPMVAVVSRLTIQKGLDLLLGALPRLLADGGQLALLGSGDAGIVCCLRRACGRWTRSPEAPTGRTPPRA